jgi:Heat induced stress protein YflT
MPAECAVFGLFATEYRAENLITALESGGFAQKDISVLLPDRKSTHDFGHESRAGASGEAQIGGAVGGTMSLLAGIGALAIPGLGVFIAAGPIIALLSGASGSVARVLAGMGVSEIAAQQYEGQLRKGDILLSVHVDNLERRKMAWELLQSGGATDVMAVGEP